LVWRIKACVSFGCQLLDGSRKNHERHLAEIRQSDIAPYLDENPSLRVLDLANGYLRPQYILLKGVGKRVYGIDLVNRPGRSCVNTAYRIARWLYIRGLGPAASDHGERLVCGDVANLPFTENSSDSVTSIAAFEHFLDVPTVVAEIRRVTCLGGLVWVWIHPFSSPSGGHNLSLTEIPLRIIPAGIDPWVTCAGVSSVSVPLNEWRIDQYVETFESHFQILKRYCAMREGEEFSTQEIENEHSPYRRDELSSGGYVILARKTL
jgi:SAM-dependent methyltransferase